MEYVEFVQLELSQTLMEIVLDALLIKFYIMVNVFVQMVIFQINMVYVLFVVK